MSKKPYVPPYEKKSYITELAIDTHAHLDYDQLDAEVVINNLQNDGLRNIISISTGLSSFKKVKELVKKDERIYFSLGLHPYDVKDFDENFKSELKKVANDYGDRMVAVGEIGLDQFGEVPPIDEQKRVLKEQLLLANELQKPVILHIRNAQSEMIQFLKENSNLLKNGGVIHCFSGNMEQAQFYLSLGLYLSFTGAVTYAKPNEQEEQIRLLNSIPLNRIMIETDSPYLSPAPYRGKPNSPKMVLVIAEYIADRLQIDTNKFIQATTDNAKRLFNIK